MPGVPLYLRIERRGDTLAASWSEDGEQWKAWKSVADLHLPEELQVGLAAVNVTNQPFEATFEDWSVTPADKEDLVDGMAEYRRILTILVAMTLVTGGFAFLGLVRWWICVPPAGVLVLYVLLLREIALADAEFARRRAAWEASEARAYLRYMQAQAGRETHEANLAESSAQIIDISGRVSDQLYDQYADAAVRAVGD